ncbi:MAG: restriction endonuclease subunit S [Pseudomonas sp.]|nr:MAG: restriction endonuclease subunit S [Pseudomonas sp.]
MSFPGYLTHKDSGSEWIGEIPQHWSASPLKRAFRIEGGSTPPPDDANWDGDIAWVTPADLSGLSSIFLDESKRTITAKGLASCGTNLLPAGSLILSTRAPIGSLGIGLVSMCTNQGCKGLVPNANAFAAYFAFVLLTARDELNNRGRGSTFLEISGDELSRFSVPLPPLKEQTQIARFLDHETARIDALIKEQQRLIELLKEKRQAVISHAVTKGLDPTVPMKDSGVEWLGEVPAHWDVARVKNIAKLESGHTPSKEFPEYWEGGDIPWVSLNDSKQLKVVDYIDETQYMITALGMNNSSARLLPARAVVFTRDATIGLAAITTRAMCVSQHLIAWICNENLMLPEYLLLVFYAMKEELGRFTFGATLKTIGMPDVRKLTTIVPSLAEQAEIVAEVSSKRELISRLIREGNKGIALLQERRSALISAAVTGKIDVRGWKPPTSALSRELAEEAV